MADTSVLDGMNRCQAHRGPDDHGFLTWSDDGAPALGRVPAAGHCRVGFAHQRLAIIDVTTAGWQPMSTSDGALSVVFNGELYNYLELRAELVREGARFRSESDTEVLLEAFALWGLDAVSRFVGMFAIAVLDTRARAVHLIRDHFGIKPLHVMTWRGGVAFASEIKTLLRLPGARHRADPAVVYDYLTLGRLDATDSSFFADIHRVPPAHIMTLPLDSPNPPVLRRYWRVPQHVERDISMDEAASRLRDLFIESVRLHLRSDVPVGTALSGGIDSSAIVAAMRAVGGAAVDIHAFGYVADDAKINEERWIDLATDATDATVHKIRVRAEEMSADIDDLVATQDEPFGSTSIYAQFRVFQRARESGIIVMLDGQGADELFAGYPTYLETRLLSLARRGQFRNVRRLQRSRAGDGVSANLARPLGRMVAQALPQRAAMGVRHARSALGRRDTHTWLNHAWFAAVGVVPATWPLHRTVRGHLIHDTTSGNLPQLLRYEDRNSMRFSLESRVPFLVPAVAEFALSLPDELLIDERGLGKAVLRRALQGLVPQAILDRRDKIGFATPEGAWLRQLQPWVDHSLNSVRDDQVPVLDLVAVRATWAAVLAGRQEYGWHVWRWLNLIRWSQNWDVEWC